jgi:hypothetical protein
MKLTMTTIFAALFATTAFAGPFGLPDHQADGYRDTGCEESQRVEILNDAGELLYTNNPTCPDKGGAGLDLAALQAAFPAPEEEEETPCKSCAPVTE